MAKRCKAIASHANITRWHIKLKQLYVASGSALPFRHACEGMPECPIKIYAPAMDTGSVQLFFPTRIRHPTAAWGRNPVHSETGFHAAVHAPWIA